MKKYLAEARNGSVAGLALLLLLGLASPTNAAERTYAADLHYELGARALRQGDSATALEQLARAVELAPDDPAALGLYARALLLEERPVAAAAVLEDLRHLEPSAPDLDLMLGLARSRLGEWPAARDHLEAARELDPGNSRVRLFLGIAYQELGDGEKAEAELREAYALDPALETAGAYRLALLALRESRPDEARRLFEEVLSQLPGSLLADSAAAYLLRIERGEARRWDAYATLGFGYDTNVNLFGDEGTATLSRENDTFADAEIGVEGIAWERDSLRLRLGYRGALTAYRQEKRLDIEANHGWAIVSYELTDNLGLDLRYDLDWVWVDWESFRWATISTRESSTATPTGASLRR
jgi:Flp pilus assembly protein TadD